MRNFSLFVLLLFGCAVGTAAQAKLAKAEVKFGFLERFEKTASGYQISVDYAEMFEGDRAEREAKKDGEPSPGETSGIYIRNKNPKIHVEKLRANAVVLALKNMEPQRLTLAEFIQLRGGKLKGSDEFWGFPGYGADGEAMPCNVTIVNGVVVKIEQVYFP